MYGDHLPVEERTHYEKFNQVRKHFFNKNFKEEFRIAEQEENVFKQVELEIGHAAKKLASIPTRISNRNINKLLKNIHQLAASSFDTEPPEIEGQIPAHFSKELLDIEIKIGEIAADNIDLVKSMKRGYRDLIKGDKLKTEMRQRIKSEIIDPLREYLNKEERNTYTPKKDLLTELDNLEKQCMKEESQGRGG